MTEAENVPNYQSRILLRAATFNNLCCRLASPSPLHVQRLLPGAGQAERRAPAGGRGLSKLTFPGSRSGA